MQNVLLFLVGKTLIPTSEVAVRILPQPPPRPSNTTSPRSSKTQQTPVPAEELRVALASFRILRHDVNPGLKGMSLSVNREPFGARH